MFACIGTDFEVGGSVAPGFEGVREAFTQNFKDGRERGAQVIST